MRAGELGRVERGGRRGGVGGRGVRRGEALVGGGEEAEEARDREAVACVEGTFAWLL